jgi:hypothetical protein
MTHRMCAAETRKLSQIIKMEHRKIPSDFVENMKIL